MNLGIHRAGVAACVVTTFFVAACGSTTTAGPPGSNGGDNGIASKSVADIETAVTAAVKNNKTFVASGAGKISSDAAQVDMQIDLQSKSMGMTMSTGNGGTAKVELVNGHTYLTMDAKFATAFGGDSGGSASTLQALANKCIDFGTASDNNPVSSDLGDFGDLGTGNLFGSTKYTKGAVKQVDGVEVVPLTDTSGNELDIATHGDPLPVSITQNSDGDTFTLTFKSWGGTVSVSAPSGCVTLAQIEQQMLGGAPTPTP